MLNYFILYEYLKVFNVWSALIDPGLIHDIIMILDSLPFDIKESLNAIVSFEALKGMCYAFKSIALIHYFRANKLLFISAPYNLLCL